MTFFLQMGQYLSFVSPLEIQKLANHRSWLSWSNDMVTDLCTYISNGRNPVTNLAMADPSKILPDRNPKRQTLGNLDSGGFSGVQSRSYIFTVSESSHSDESLRPSSLNWSFFSSTFEGAPEP